ncbi:hypothetical protein LINPERPRIM_LOCUS3437 [Linum perenne]
MRPLSNRPPDIRRRVLHPALGGTLPVPRERDLLLLLCVPRGGEEQRMASLHQVPSHDGDAAGDLIAGGVVHKQLLPSHSLQWQARYVLLGRDRVRVCAGVAAVCERRSRRRVCLYSVHY